MKPRRREKKGKKSVRRSLKKGKSASLTAGLVLLSIFASGALVHESRKAITQKYQKLDAEMGVYAIPQEEQLLVFSLGYRAALADLLFGRTLVSAGIHFAERRVFHHLDAYLLGILALEPDYLDVYMMADTLLNLSTVEMPLENFRTARTIQERGLERFPNHEELWHSVGQFIAYFAPPRLPENENPAEWKLRGSEILQHACDIWPDPSDLPDSCLNSANLMLRQGENEAAIQALERLIAIADDPNVRSSALTKLSRLLGERVARKRAETLVHIDDLRMRQLPDLNRTLFQLLVPLTDLDTCAGLHAPPAALECATSFETYGDLVRPFAAGKGE